MDDPESTLWYTDMLGTNMTFEKWTPETDNVKRESGMSINSSRGSLPNKYVIRDIKESNRRNTIDGTIIYTSFYNSEMDHGLSKPIRPSKN